MNYRLIKVVMASMLLSFLSIGVNADHNWQRTNPGGGGAFSTIDAGPSGIVIAGSDLSGAYISKDKGQTWEVIGASRGMMDTHISGIGFDAYNENLIYLGTTDGIWRSSDQGDSFTQVLNHGEVTDIETSESDPSIVYAAYATAWNSDQSFIYRSTDNGQTWRQRSHVLNGYRILNILVSKQDKNRLYVLTGKARSVCGPAEVYWSTDGGKSLQRIGLTLGNIMDLKVDPSNHNVVYLTTFNGGCGEKWYYTDRKGKFFRSYDGGNNWQEMSQKTGIICIKADNPSIIRRIDPRNVHDWNSQSGTWTTIDYGITWRKTGDNTQWENGHRIGDKSIGLTSDGFAKSLGNDMSNPDVIYNVTTQWVYGSFDGGNMFHNLFTKEISPDFWQSTGFDNVNMMDMKISEANSDIIFLGYFDIGLWRSLDHGLSWQQCNSRDFTGSWGENGGNVTSICLDPVRTNVVWATMSVSQNAEDPQYLVRSDNTGERKSWVASNTGLPLDSIMGISIDKNSPVNNRTLYCTARGDVYKSSDDGTSWKKVLENKGLWFTAVHNYDSACVYAGGGHGLYRSLNGGNSWTKVGLSEMEGTTAFWGRDNGKGVFDIAPGIHNPDWVYVTCKGEDKGAYRSKNKGSTWKKIYTDDFLRKIAISPNDKNILYITSSKAMESGGSIRTSKGVLFSDNRGASFTQANQGMAWPFAMTVSVDDDGWVFVGSPGTGFQKSRVP